MLLLSGCQENGDRRKRSYWRIGQKRTNLALRGGAFGAKPDNFNIDPTDGWDDKSLKDSWHETQIAAQKRLAMTDNNPGRCEKRSAEAICTCSQ